MTNKIAYYGLAAVVAVVMAGGLGIGTAGEVLAGNEGAGYGTSDSSFSSEPATVMEDAVAEDIREPIGTGALPQESRTEDPEGWVNMNVAEQDASPELRGRPNIQSGGGGD
ncbi:MAG: hypothetical protein NCA08_11385 [Deltaproteobacteria bacterium]|nr:hypothetical protein [Candidatus Deferrimicrobium borealis]